MRRWRCIAAAAGAHNPVNNRHANPGQIALMDAFQHITPRCVLGGVHQHKIGAEANLNDAAIKITHTRCIAGGKTKGNFRRNITKAGQHGNHPQNTKRLHS